MTESLLSATTEYNLACPVYISHGAIMTRENEHQQTIIEQFSLQAIPFAALPGHSSSISLLIELCGPTALGNVLDVACGPGLVACEFARVARSVTGIDLTPAMLTAARERQRAAGLSNMEWLEGDAFPLPFADHSFDAVLTRYRRRSRSTRHPVSHGLPWRAALFSADPGPSGHPSGWIACRRVPIEPTNPAVARP